MTQATEHVTRMVVELHGPGELDDRLQLDAARVTLHESQSRERRFSVEGQAAVLMWFVLWGLAVAPVPG